MELIMSNNSLLEKGLQLPMNLSKYIQFIIPTQTRTHTDIYKAQGSIRNGRTYI